jgi:hypothetical protein
LAASTSTGDRFRRAIVRGRQEMTPDASAEALE